MNILHITDLHLDNFHDQNEFLREGFYREYIDRLHKGFKKKIDPFKIDYLIVTGDFINRGKTENYQYVEEILRYFADTFSISTSKICVSIGNHDYKWKELDAADAESEKKLREPFNTFKGYFNSNYIKNSDHYFLSKLDNNTYFLSIDSSWRSNNGEPGELSISEEDEIVNLIRNELDNTSTLLIGCHFPIISLDNNFLSVEEDDWHTRHVWIKGATLLDRLKSIQTRNTIWFHGDVHASDQKIIEDQIFVLTSKFGGVPDTSQQNRQAILIQIANQNIQKFTCNYQFPGHNQDQRLGDWRCSDSHKLREISPVKENSSDQHVDELIAFNKEVEKEILRLVKEHELYKFGRFHVSDEYISLGWVQINRLMTDKDLLTRISDKCYEIIHPIVKNDKANSLFIGIEIIGGILASQLSVRFEIKNSIIPIRRKSDHYSEFEFSDSTLYENISGVKNVFIFIDLISSGETINSLIDDILSKNSKIHIHVISIITNDIKNKVDKIPRAKSYHTFCTALKIPIIRHDEMPSEEYLKPNMKI